MKGFMKRIFLTVLILAILGGGIYGFFEYYPYLFSKTVKGKVIKVSRVNDTIAIMGNEKANSQIYSFAVAVKADDGTIYTSSTEDRQWAAVTEGICVEVRFYVYPPWNLDKAGTYYNARLKSQMDCK